MRAFDGNGLGVWGCWALQKMVGGREATKVWKATKRQRQRAQHGGRRARTAPGSRRSRRGEARSLGTPAAPAPQTPAQHPATQKGGGGALARCALQWRGVGSVKRPGERAAARARRRGRTRTFSFVCSASVMTSPKPFSCCSGSAAAGAGRAAWTPSGIDGTGINPTAAAISPVRLGVTGVSGRSAVSGRWRRFRLLLPAGGVHRVNRRPEGSSPQHVLSVRKIEPRSVNKRFCELNEMCFYKGSEICFHFVVWYVMEP